VENRRFFIDFGPPEAALLRTTGFSRTRMNKGVLCITLPAALQKSLGTPEVALPHAVRFVASQEDAERRDTGQQLAKENITWQLE
jgi:hypothetical protein